MSGTDVTLEQVEGLEAKPAVDWRETAAEGAACGWICEESGRIRFAWRTSSGWSESGRLIIPPVHAALLERS